MGREREKEGCAQGIDIRASICATPPWILFWRSVAWCPLVTNEKECSIAFLCRFRIPKINQNRSLLLCDANIIWFNVTVNDRRLLTVEERNRITDRKQPLEDLRYRNNIILLTNHTNPIRQVIAINVTENNI